jgi:hypothetical protein
MPHSAARARRDALVLDPLQLAWAAGFFDGEGTTSATARLNRPRYFRLAVSVPQSGHAGPPEVLFRFQAAVLGMGSITGPNDDDMYLWRADNFVEAQATVALLWSQLGPIKRAQAAAAMRAVHQQYSSGTYRPRHPRRSTTPRWHVTSSFLRSPRELDLAWAAGFLDGEGPFGLPQKIRRKDGSVWRRLRVSVSQNSEPERPAEVLLRLQRILGGRIERHGDADDFRWLIDSGARVQDVFARVRPWLGTVKQEQAQCVIDIYRSQVRRQGSTTKCARGHPYDNVRVGGAGSKRRCNACARMRSRMRRAAKGIAPRRFKNVARRYNF